LVNDPGRQCRRRREIPDREMERHLARELRRAQEAARRLREDQPEPREPSIIEDLERYLREEC
jgi:hypothetical protein